VRKWKPQHSTKSHTSRKNFSSKCIPDRGFKKTPFRRGLTPEFDDSYTLPADFSGAQGCQKGVEINSKWHLRAPQNAKNQEKWALKKTLKTMLRKLGSGANFELKKKGFFAQGASLKSQKTEISSKWAPGFQNEPLGL